MKTQEIDAGQLERDDVYREFGDGDDPDDWRKIVWIGWHGDTVLITYGQATATDPNQMQVYDTTLDRDTMVEKQVP